jgi:hypothetical protein
VAVARGEHPRPIRRRGAAGAVRAGVLIFS